MNGNRFDSVRVVDLLMIQMGTYDLQYRRPYLATANDHIIDGIVERLDRSPIYTPELFSGVANTFLEPTAAPESELIIPGDWDRQRYGFLLKVECTYRTGGKIIEYVQGYTNPQDIIVQPTRTFVDPQMEFYINSVTTVRETLEQSPNMTGFYTSAAETSHVLADNNFNGVYASDKTQRMRPEDVFATMSRASMQGEIVDGRSVLTNQAIKSDRRNNSALAYSSTLFQKYKEANQEANGVGQSEVQVLATARNLSAEEVAGMDPFMKAINNYKQNAGGVIGNMFRYRDLEAMAPHVDSVTKIMQMDNEARAESYWAGQGEDWGKANRYQQVATIIGHSMAAILLENMFTAFTLTCTNQHQSGSHLLTTGSDCETYVDDPASFEARFNEVLRRATHQVFHDVTWGNGIPFYAHVEIDLTHDTKIWLNLDHQGEVMFAIPSFTDSLAVPILTGNGELAVNNARSFDGIFSKLHQSGSLGRMPGMNRQAFGRI